METTISIWSDIVVPYNNEHSAQREIIRPLGTRAENVISWPCSLRTIRKSSSTTTFLQGKLGFTNPFVPNNPGIELAISEIELTERSCYTEPISVTCYYKQNVLEKITLTEVSKLTSLTKSLLVTDLEISLVVHDNQIPIFTLACYKPLHHTADKNKQLLDAQQAGCSIC